MKKLFLPIFLIIASVGSVRAIKTSVSFATFKKDKQGFVEIYVEFVGRTLEQKQIDSINSQADVEVRVSFKKGGDIVKSETFMVKSPPSLDPVDFYEAKQYALDNGVYDLEIGFKDMNKPENVGDFHTSIAMNYDEVHLQQSEIELASYVFTDNSGSPMTKNGISIQGLPSGVYGKGSSELIFYNEIYNSEKFTGIDFIYSYWIERTFDEGTPKPLMKETKVLQAEEIVRNLIHMDVKRLPSDVYKLVAIVRNGRNGDILSRKEAFFERENPNLDTGNGDVSSEAINNEFVGAMKLDELRYGLRAISMQMEGADVATLKTILSGSDTMAYRRFLYAYWLKKRPGLPEQGYDEYMFNARKTDKEFATASTRGLETDRGKALMKYGQPTDIINVDNEVNTPPYEIWSYEKSLVANQQKGKFLFYNPDRSENGLKLLHSTFIGELNNPQWKAILYKGQETLSGDAKANATRSAIRFMENE